MERGFLSLDAPSEYLNLKRSTLYSLVESGGLPHYRIGRLIRFKQDDVVQWMEEHKREGIDLNNKAKGIMKATNRSKTEVDTLVKKSIAEVKGLKYTSNHGRPDHDRAKKEVEHGTLSSRPGLAYVVCLQGKTLSKINRNKGSEISTENL